jgi:hypothetical protein
MNNAMSTKVAATDNFVRVNRAADAAMERFPFITFSDHCHLRYRAENSGYAERKKGKLGRIPYFV